MLEASGVTARVTFDGHTITITRTGVQQRGQVRIPVGQIVGVRWTAPSLLFNGWVRFETAAIVGRQVRRQTQAIRDEHSVVFRRGQAGEFEAVRDAVEAALR